MTNKKLKEILDKHQKWVKGEPDGERADLRYENLYDASLSGADLKYAILCGADLSEANLSGADLSEANLSSADLREADLHGANLSNAVLRFTNLYHANISNAYLFNTDLRCADLHHANLCRAKLNNIRTNMHTRFFALQCPEKGAYTAYKTASGKIVELEIPADALRSSATSRKCRASKAKVISITNIDGTPAGKSVRSNYTSSFVYTVGETVEVPNFDTDRWNECAYGIHHFITRDEAVQYQ